MRIEHPSLLITDDDSDFREALREVFERRGFRILLARDGEQALETVQRELIHVALFDMHMPKLTGLETMRRLRASHGQLPCILISGGLNAEICEQARQASAFSVMSKPVSSKEITGAVHDALRQVYDWHPTF